MGYKLKENKKGELSLKSISVKIPHKVQKEIFGNMPQDDNRPMAIGVRADKLSAYGYSFYISTIQAEDESKIKADFFHKFLPGLCFYNRDGDPDKACEYIGKSIVRLMEKISDIEELSSKKKAEIISACTELLHDPSQCQPYASSVRLQEKITDVFDKENSKYAAGQQKDSIKESGNDSYDGNEIDDYER